MIELKLYVWHDWMPDYTGGLAIVIARTSNEAKEILYNDYTRSYGSPQEEGEKLIEDDYHNLRDPEIFLIKHGVVFHVEGGA